MARRDATAERCLLIVDDEEDFLVPASYHFERQGYRVLSASDGRQALDLFDAAPAAVDLVITDIRMPRMGGEELIRELHARRRHLPILGVTGQADVKEKLRLLGSGAYYYFEKPLPDLRLIDNLVANAIRLHRHEEKLREMRRKEESIARLVRGHMVHGLAPASAGGGDAGLGLDIALLPIQLDQPSGDFVEWFERVGDEVLFYIADASGHDDLVATFLTLLSVTVLHRIHHRGRPEVHEIIVAIDDALERLRSADLLDGSKYLTFFMGALDLASGELTYVNAGHPEALLFRAPGDGRRRRVERLSPTCGPVGMLKLIGREPSVGRRLLERGDTLLVYTDGASESLGDSHAAGVDRLISLARPLVGGSAQAVVTGIADGLEQAAQPHGIEDDTTLLAMCLLD